MAKCRVAGCTRQGEALYAREVDGMWVRGRICQEHAEEALAQMAVPVRKVTLMHHISEDGELLSGLRMYMHD